MLSLRLLGGLSISRDSKPITGPAAQPSRLALLAVLAAPEPRSVSRDKLVGLLWPDHDVTRGRRNLSDALYVLRQELGEEAIVATGDAIHLDPALVDVDVAAFEAALARGAAREAVALYEGPLLDGVYLRDTTAFERWVEEHRDRLARGYEEALESLALTAEEAGHVREAVRWRSALAGERPYDTAAVIGLMRALERAGDPAAALEAGHLHEERLREELDAEPDPRLEAELERVRTAPEGGEAELPAPGGSHRSAPMPAEEEVPTAHEAPAAQEASAETAAGDADAPEEPVPSAPDGGWEPTAGWKPSGRRLALAIGLAAVVGALLTFVLTRSESPSAGLDPDRVAVFPFRVAGASPSLGYLEEGMPVLIAAKLTDEPGSVRAVDSRTALAAWSRSVGGDADVATDRIREVAAGLGAGSALVGEVVGTDERLTVTARLLPADPAADPVVAEATGPVDSLSGTVDRLVVALLVESSEAAGARSLASLTTGSLPALRAFLAGTKAWRQGERDEAIARYGEALDRDSTFALAAMGLAEAATTLPGGITGRHPFVRRGLRLATAHWEKLGPEDRRYLEALAGPRYPAAIYPMDEVLDLWRDVAHELRDRPEAWHHLGWFLAEFGPQAGRADAHELAASHLSQAVRLDSTFVPALEHLIGVYAKLGDRAAVERLAPHYLGLEPSGEDADYTRWRIALIAEDEETLERLRSRFESMNSISLTRIVGFGQIDRVGLDEARRAADVLWRRVRDRQMSREAAGRRTNLYLLKSFAVNRGQPARADTLLRMRWEGSTSSREYHRDRIVAALYEGGDTTGIDASVRGLSEGRFTSEGTTAYRATEAGERALDLCLVHQWRLWQGDTVDAASAIERVRAAEPIAGAPCASILTILLAAERGGEDARRAVPLAEEMLADGWLWPVGFMVDFAAARLYERLGEPLAGADALRQRPYRAQQGQWTLGHALHEIGRLSLAGGDTAAAIESYDHWLALQDAPEESRRDEVERVRALVERLEGGRRR